MHVTRVPIGSISEHCRDMKFVQVIFLALVCTNLYFCQADNTTGNQKICGTQGSPININVYGNGGLKGEKGVKGDTGTSCKCSLQDPNKPSAHIEAVNKLVVTYRSNQVLKEWNPSDPNSHLAGGMKYHDGKLTVPTPGRYYIYAQIYYFNNGRVIVRVNNKRIAIVQPMSGRGTLYAAGVFILKAGDVITLTPDGSTPRVYLSPNHSYFGAFLI